jgi:hypothetical protein
MQYAVFDLFGGTTELFDDQNEALETANRLLEHYQSTAFEGYWQHSYAPDIVIVRVTHRAVQVIGAATKNHNDCLASSNYQMVPVAACFSTQS